MLHALKKLFGTQTAYHSTKSIEPMLFSESAYFSNQVPKTLSEIWVAHGGDISSGTILDRRARYFFATDPSEPWVTKLFAKSVMVIHAGWIAHCVDEVFKVPIAEYILDDKFVPGPPYKLINNVPPIYVPLSEPSEPIYTESGESGPTPVQPSDTPSTPTSMPRKRKREQAYFDSPSGSLVFSAFGKDGMPRRPRKQRKLRFDPSFSPDAGQSGRKATQGGFDWLRDDRDTSRGDDEFSQARSQHRAAGALRVPIHMTTVRSPDTPDKPLADGGPPASHRHISMDERLSQPTHVSSSAIAIDARAKIPPIRTIDFTNLPPRNRRWRFPGPEATTSGATGTNLLVVKPTEHKVKTPKKISFADHARVCVYMVSPQRLDANGASTSSARPCFCEAFEDEPGMEGRTRMSSVKIESSDDSMIQDFAPQTDSPKIKDEPVLFLGRGGDPFENGTLTLTMEEVEAMRRRLLESAESDGVENGQLATLFELGRTFRGMAFRHVW